MLTIKCFEVNPLQENCYIVSDETKECVIIDCGAFYGSERMAVKQYIDEHQLHPVHLLNTHLHFDHVWGNSFLYDTFQLMTEASGRDQFLYDDVPGQIKQLVGEVWKEPFFAPLGKNLAESDCVSFGSHQFSVISTPGHTPGGICFYCRDEKVLFTGDSLFYCSIGRTDLQGGSHQDLTTALKEKVLTLDSNTIVYPGHGPKTKIETEKLYNPYL